MERTVHVFQPLATNHTSSAVSVQYVAIFDLLALYPTILRHSHPQKRSLQQLLYFVITLVRSTGVLLTVVTNDGFASCVPSALV